MRRHRRPRIHLQLTYLALEKGMVDDELQARAGVAVGGGQDLVLATLPGYIGKGRWGLFRPCAAPAGPEEEEEEEGRGRGRRPSEPQTPGVIVMAPLFPTRQPQQLEVPTAAAAATAALAEEAKGTGAELQAMLKSGVLLVTVIECASPPLGMRQASPVQKRAGSSVHGHAMQRAADKPAKRFLPRAPFPPCRADQERERAGKDAAVHQTPLDGQGGSRGPWAEGHVPPPHACRQGRVPPAAFGFDLKKGVDRLCMHSGRPRMGTGGSAGG